MAAPLLEVRDLRVSFTHYASGLKLRHLDVIEGLDMTIEEGQITAVIGASGSGKSLLAHAILGILPGGARMSGTIRYKGSALDMKRLEALRGTEIVFIPQSVAYLDPTMRVGKQVRLAAQRAGYGSGALQRQRQVFAQYRLEERVERMFPFELSGGMARRVLNAAAAVNDRAKLVIADEPTPGLAEQDVREALLQLRSMADRNCGVLLITHHIEAALSVADRIVVLYAGTMAEEAHRDDFAGDGMRLRHPYTRALWRALPQNGMEPIEGVQPQPGERPDGCLFAPRCPLATGQCRERRPEPRDLRGGMVRCIHAT
jgi:peptide/nickel transport system ATP-binding protein